MTMGRISEQQAAELETLSKLTEKDIDTCDIPELTSLEGAERSRFYRPVKKPVTIRPDADIPAWFK